MKSISKAMIAVMVAAVMCAVPLFIIEDSEAIDIKAGEAGISFKAGSVSDENFEKLTGGDAKEGIYAGYASSVVGAVVEDDTRFNVDASTVKITNVKDVKLARGMKITSDSYAMTTGQEMTFDVEFKATAMSGGKLFNLYDGTQTLYKELGKTNSFSATDTLEFKGTATISSMMSSDYTIAKTYSDYYVATEGTAKMSQFASFSGEVTFKNGTTYKITIDKAEKGMSSDSSFTFDFYDVKPASLTSESKYMRTNTGDGSMTDVLKYKINDKSDGYDMSYNSKDLPSYMAGNMYYVGEVGTLAYSGYLFTASLSVPDFLYYDGSDYPNEETSFFNKYSVKDDNLKSNDKMKEFLDDIGNVGDSYSSAESAANGAYESVSASGSGGSNIIFYVIIGVLAVAVVALAVLMIKKK